MFMVDCAYRREGGGLRFIRESRMDEATDDLCILRVTFRIDDIYPAEPDTGAGMDWNGGIDTVEMRNCAGWTRWRLLRDGDLAAALAFLEQDYAREMFAAETEHAEAIYYGEAA